MNYYTITLVLGCILILLWKKFKHTLANKLAKSKIETFSKANIERAKEKQLKNLYVTSTLLVLWPITKFSMLYLLTIPFLMVIAYFIPILSIKKEEKKEVKQLKYDFPIWLRQLQVLLQNNNVLHALELSEESAPAIMREDLHELIEAIRMNSTSSDPYYNFMSAYGVYEINRAMKLLYRYQMMGAEDSYHQFQKMLEATRKWLRAEREDKRSDTINMMNWIGLAPLLGATALFMILMVLTLTQLMKGGFTV